MNEKEKQIIFNIKEMISNIEIRSTPNNIYLMYNITAMLNSLVEDSSIVIDNTKEEHK